MLPKLARGLFLVTVVTLIAVYAVAAANSTPTPVDPQDFVVQWC
jgi:hypothetical protein